MEPGFCAFLFHHRTTDAVHGDFGFSGGWRPAPLARAGACAKRHFADSRQQGGKGGKKSSVLWLDAGAALTFV